MSSTLPIPSKASTESSASSHSSVSSDWSLTLSSIGADLSLTYTKVVARSSAQSSHAPTELAIATDGAAAMSIVHAGPARWPALGSRDTVLWRAVVFDV